MRVQFMWAMLALISIPSVGSLRADDDIQQANHQSVNVQDDAGEIHYYASASPEAMPMECGYGNCGCNTPCCNAPCCNAPCCGCCNECGCTGGSCTCDSCTGICGCDTPCLVGRVSWVYMHRSNPSSVALLNNPAGVNIFNANQFDFGWDSGVDAEVLHNLSCDWGVDVRYFGINDYVASTPLLALPAGSALLTTPPSTTVVNSIVNAQYRSDIQSAEISLRRNYGNIGLSGGFRYVDLDEELDATFLPAIAVVPPARAAFKTGNHLYGFQFGADTVCWQNCNGFHIDAFGKAGIYGNEASSSAELIGRPITTAKNGEVSFLGELGFLGVYPITEHLHLQGGYQMMWITGVAVASDQVARTSSFSSPAPLTSTIDTTGSIFYHGANLGLEFTW